MLRGVPFPVAAIAMVALIAAIAILAIRSIKKASVEPTYTAEQVEATKAAGQTILDAIAKYQAEKGQPPWRIESLIPTHLAAIPPNAMPYAEWSYELREDRKAFSLGFTTTSRRDHGWWWQSDIGGWREVKP